MKRTTALILLAVVVFAGASVFAHDETFKGTVISTTISTKDAKLHVSVIDEKTKKESPMEFVITAKTKVLRGDKVVKFADAKIAKGERIAVTVNHDESMTGATVIRLAAQAQASNPQQHAAAMKGLTEAEFIPMMIAHHRGGIAMSKHQEEKGSSAAVKALAARIRQGQERELAELNQYASHARGASTTSSHAAHEKSMEQEHQTTMKRLQGSSGQALDHAFLDEMTKHHQMAIAMAEGAKLQTPAIKAVAQKMVKSQRQEQAEIKKLMGAYKN